MAYQKTISDLAAALRQTEAQAKSTLFQVVDFLIDNISQEAIDCGAYHNSPMNGDRRMVESFKAILWAQFEELDGQKPQASGPWVAIGMDGISIHRERPVYAIRASGEQS